LPGRVARRAGCWNAAGSGPGTLTGASGTSAGHWSWRMPSCHSHPGTRRKEQVAPPDRRRAAQVEQLFRFFLVSFGCLCMAQFRWRCQNCATQRRLARHSGRVKLFWRSLAHAIQGCASRGLAAEPQWKVLVAHEVVRWFGVSQGKGTGRGPLQARRGR